MNSVTMKNTIARRPTRPIARAFGALVMPTMRLPTTSGMTVIRIALIQSVPSGSIANAARASVGRAAARDRDAGGDAGDERDEDARGEGHALM